MQYQAKTYYFSYPVEESPTCKRDDFYYGIICVYGDVSAKDIVHKVIERHKFRGDNLDKSKLNLNLLETTSDQKFRTFIFSIELSSILEFCETGDGRYFHHSRQLKDLYSNAEEALRLTIEGDQQYSNPAFAIFGCNGYSIRP